MTRPHVISRLEVKERVFHTAWEAAAAVGPPYASRLCFAGQKDQDHPDEVFVLRPAGTTSPPLVLIGGMGPLAGAAGFEHACRLFLNTRELVLLQACSIPDRTTAIKEIVRDRASALYVAMTDSLTLAIAEGIRHVTSDDAHIDLIVLCNTSHFFLGDVLERLHNDPSIGSRLRFASLVDAAIEVMCKKRYRRIMALYTEGTRLSRVYSDRFTKESLRYIEPVGDLEYIERLLMTAIYSVKAFEYETALRLGTRIFRELLALGNQFDCVLAGCTEIPLIIEAMKAKGCDEITDFISRFEIIDPVSEALRLI